MKKRGVSILERRKKAGESNRINLCLHAQRLLVVGLQSARHRRPRRLVQPQRMRPTMSSSHEPPNADGTVPSNQQQQKKMAPIVWAETEGACPLGLAKGVANEPSGRVAEHRVRSIDPLLPATHKSRRHVSAVFHWREAARSLLGAILLEFVRELARHVHSRPLFSNR